MGIQVLVISHLYPNRVNPISGIFVHSQVKALMKLGVEVRVVSPTPSFPFYPKWKRYPKQIEQHVYDGVPVYYVPTRMFPGGLFFSHYGKFYMQSLQSIVEKIHQDFPFDLIHCHTLFPDGYAGVNLKTPGNVPVVISVHGSDIMIYPQRSRRIYEQVKRTLLSADQVIAVSQQAMKDSLEVQPESKVRVIYNGFSSDLFYPMDREEARKKLELNAKKKRFLFVGNLYPVKGLTYLLEAFNQVAQDVPEVHLDIVGDGNLRSALEDQVRKQGRTAQVTFHGRRPYHEIPLWINSADAVVLSSLSEGLSAITLETQGCGRVMVATAVGGIKELIVHGETGYMCPSEDGDCLGNYLKKIVRDESRTLQIEERAYLSSRQRSWDHNAQLVKNTYMDMLNNKCDG